MECGLVADLVKNFLTLSLRGDIVKGLESYGIVDRKFKLKGPRSEQKSCKNGRRSIYSDF